MIGNWHNKIQQIQCEIWRQTATVAIFNDKLSPLPATIVAEIGDCCSRQCGQGLTVGFLTRTDGVELS